MQTRRSGLSPLAIVLPHPPLLHRRSSLLSVSSAASPHTPRSSGCFDGAPPPPVCYAPNRKSSDSWASSNADEMDVDWKPDQTLLLTRTLDALPAHLVTPFHGSVPPSNLLDKIARGVAHAKGPADWPHSTRATRAKLLELARARAKEDALAEQRRHAIQEEEHDADGCDDAVEIADGSADSAYGDMHAPALADNPIRGVGIGPRRPLYRQSSMDFIKPGAAALKDNPNIARLSTRLQRTEQTFPNPGFHPYARAPRARAKSTLQHENDRSSIHNNRASNHKRRSESPPHQSDVPSLMAPSTPSSTTLNSVSSLSSSSAAPLSLGLALGMGLRPRALRRSASTLSSGTSSLFSSSSASSGGGMALDPRLQRVRRSDSFGAGGPPPPPLPPKDYPLSMAGFKRAPSYGTLAQEAKTRATSRDKENEAEKTPQKDAGVYKHARQLSAGSYPSSDEEEKARTKKAKKLRTRTAPGVDAMMMSPGGAVDGPPSSVPPSPATPAVVRGKRAIAGSPKVSRTREPLSPPAMKEREKEKEAPVASRTRSNSSRGVLLSPIGGKEKAEAEVWESQKDARDVEVERETKKAREVLVKEKTKRGSHVKTSSASAEKRGRDMDKDNNNNNASSRDKDVAHIPAPPASAHQIARPPRMSAQRNPSMFGAELPLFKAAPSLPTPAPASVPPARLRSPELVLAHRAPALLPALAAAANPITTAHTRGAKDDPPTAPSSPASPALRHVRPMSPASPASPSSPLSPDPASPRVKTLRRVRRLAGARRISFGSLVPEEGRGESQVFGGGLGEGFAGDGGVRRDARERERERERERGSLGSAFQMM